MGITLLSSPQSLPQATVQAPVSSMLDSRMVAAMLPIYFSMYVNAMGLGQGYSAQLIGSDLGTVTFACQGRHMWGTGRAGR
jgi:hypothetical protein